MKSALKRYLTVELVDTDVFRKVWKKYIKKKKKGAST
jgi:hypothetical protein